MSNVVVLDNSAILAALDEETGADIVRNVLFYAHVSTVTLAEAYSTLSFRGLDGPEALAEMRFAFESIDPFNEEMAEIAGKLRPITKAAGLSLGDRACIALGMFLDVPVYTADRVWAKLQLPCRIHLIR